MAREYGIGDRFVARSRVTMAPGFVDKMVERGISADEVRAVLASNEVFEVVLGRRRYGLVGTVEGRPAAFVGGGRRDNQRNCPHQRVPAGRGPRLVRRVGMAAEGAAVSETAHYDGGRLIATTVTHDHVEHHPDGSVSAVAVTGVPARVCEICSAAFYDDDIGFLLAEVIRENLPPAGQAVTVAFPGRQAA